MKTPKRKTKTCSRCKEEKPIKHFTRLPSNRYRYFCDDCEFGKCQWCEKTCHHRQKHCSNKCAYAHYKYLYTNFLIIFRAVRTCAVCKKNYGVHSYNKLSLTCNCKKCIKEYRKRRLQVRLLEKKEEEEVIIVPEYYKTEICWACTEFGICSDQDWKYHGRLFCLDSQPVPNKEFISRNIMSFSL